MPDHSTCRKCLHENLPGYQFCTTCGSALIPPFSLRDFLAALLIALALAGGLFIVPPIRETGRYPGYLG